LLKGFYFYSKNPFKSLRPSFFLPCRQAVVTKGAARLNHLAEAVVHDYETVNGSTITALLEHVKQKYLSNNTIHLVQDGAGYHRSKEVKDKATELGITLHYLPPYSPNLNPIERLWKVMNEYVCNNRYFSIAKEFR
jgi:transposase